MNKVNQKELIHLICKSTDKTIKEVANHLGLIDSAFSMTLKRNNLLFNQFCNIYKYIYKEEFKTGEKLLDNKKGSITVTLEMAVSMLEENNTPIIVTTYKKTKVKLINDKK
tara:strand:- start:205 stop:537 length:333 start_codon:yes stop_codon:yes gene_type:complete